jgi:hypothetical protein
MGTIGRYTQLPFVKRRRETRVCQTTHRLAAFPRNLTHIPLTRHDPQSQEGKKALSAFIRNSSWPNSRIPLGSPGTLYQDCKFCLDLQGVLSIIFPRFRSSMCSAVSAQITKTTYNLRIQTNDSAPNAFIQKVAPKSVAAVLENFASQATAAAVRRAFHNSVEENQTVTT